MIKIQELNKFIGRLSKKDKLIFYCAVVFVLLAILDRAIISPVYNKIRSLNNEIKEKESGITKDLHILAQKERIISQINKYSSYMASIGSEEEGITTLLKEVESLANKSSLYIVDMKPQGVKQDKDGTRKFMVSLSCEGQMDQVIDFMYNIENSQSLLVIERYQLSPKTRESSLATCSFYISRVVM